MRHLAFLPLAALLGGRRDPQEHHIQNVLGEVLRLSVQNVGLCFYGLSVRVSDLGFPGSDFGFRVSEFGSEKHHVQFVLREGVEVNLCGFRVTSPMQTSGSNSPCRCR